MILAKKVDYGQKIRFCEKKVGNFSTSKCSKNCAFRYFSKTNFLRGSFRLKKRPFKGFCEKTKRTVFLTIFVNLQKRLETAVLEGHCKFSMKSIICDCLFFLSSGVQWLLPIVISHNTACFLYLYNLWRCYRCVH